VENHIICQSCNVLQHEDKVTRLHDNDGFVVVKYPWNDDVSHGYSSIPLYVSMMQDLTLLCHDQWKLIDNLAQLKKACRNMELRVIG